MVRLFVVLAALLLSLASLAGCASQPPLPPKAIEMNHQGAAALAAGDLETAEARLALALEYNPRFTEARVNLGLVELSRGDFARAKKELGKGRDLNPDLPAPHHALGLLAEKTDHAPAAEKHYLAAIKVDPGFGPARANLGRLYFRRGAFDAAREQFLRLTEIDPTALDGWLGLVESLLRVGREGDADVTLVRARARFGDMPELALLVVRQMLRRGAYAEAEVALAPLTEDGDVSRRAVAWSWIAVARASVGNNAGATTAARQALTLTPAEPVALHVLASLR